MSNSFRTTNSTGLINKDKKISFTFNGSSSPLPQSLHGDYLKHPYSRSLVTAWSKVVLCSVQS